MNLKNLLIIFLLSQFWGCIPITQMLFPFNPLPKPNGVYNIGTRIFTWTDSSRYEWFTEKDTANSKNIKSK